MTTNTTPGTTGLIMEEPLLNERSHKGRKSCCLPTLGFDPPELSEFGDLLRDETAGLPELSEVDIVRHYFRLSQWNYNVESGLYPLGSCTMKHNPKVNEKVARLAGFTATHPYDPESLVQGNLELLYRLEQALKASSGFEAITLQPAAGAHGELTASHDGAGVPYRPGQTPAQGACSRQRPRHQPRPPAPLRVFRWWKSKPAPKATLPRKPSPGSWMTISPR